MRTRSLSLFLLALTWAVSMFAGTPQPQTGSASSISQFQPYIEYLAEFSNRRKANVYFQNPQSVFNGVQIGFVNVGTGNATFLRRDLVTAGRIPIIVARLFDSADSSSADFGPGWMLAGAETIEITTSGFARLRTESGSVFTFVQDGNAYKLERDVPSDIVSLAKDSNGNLVLSLRTGFTKEYGVVKGIYRLQRVLDRNHNELRLLYNADGLITRLENEGHSVSFSRNGAGRVLSATDDKGRTVSYKYDSQGRFTGTQDLAGNLWSYGYTGLNRLHVASDPEGRVNFKVWYQSDGRVNAVELPSGKISYGYDLQSHTTTVVDRKSLVSRYVQSPEGITTRVTNALGDTTEIVLDSSRNVAKLVRNGQPRFSFMYDKDHRLISSTDHTGSGELSATYAYDSNGFLTAINYSDGTKRTFSYDAVGNLLSVLNGSISQFSYSAQGDLLGFTHEGTVLSLKSDADGLVASVGDGERTATFAYGPGGRPADVNLANGTSIHTIYSPLGLRKRLEFSDGRSLEYTFDAAANLVTTKFATLDGEITGQTMVLDNSYQLVKQILGNGRVNTFKYDANGNLLYADLATGVVKFEYDPLNRLIAVITPQGTRLEYTYQPGEPSLVTRAHGGQYGSEWSGRIDTGLVYLGQTEALAIRSHNASFGSIGFSETLGEFQSTVQDGGELLSGELQAERLVENLRLADALDAKGEKHFLAPSNSLYLPGEYAGMNCCICGSGGPQLPCDYCYPDPPTVSLSCNTQNLSFGATAPASTVTGSCVATGSPTGGSFSWSTNKTTISLNASGPSATYTSANPSSAVGDTQITVRYTKNGASDSDSSAPITVHKPAALLVVSDTTNPTGENCSVHCLDKIGSTCATTTAKSTTCSYSSYLRKREYSVLDQLTPANQFQNVGITAATITESQPFVTTCTNATLPVGSAPTSVFTDSFFLCHTCCLQGGPGCSASTNPVQTISVNGEAVRTETINWSCSNVTLNP